eukprot:TRINITY_DN9638_c0_g1_i1.p1 TRINITY_DN9638_c0_g1~~TRINITY_DN9638_c0_g1_i1.p1  ORF type:complete len:1224 (+),score=388.39 TRINITY_DN9638_c0_g1_i1:499-4170(+)
MGSPEGVGRGEIFAMLMLSVLRTYLMDTSSTVVRMLTKSVYEKNMDLFFTIGKRALSFALFGAFINAAISYCRERLVVLWRQKLTQEIHRKYFATMNYYYIGTTKKPKAIPDADSTIIREVTSTSTRLVTLVALLIKSLPPIVWFTYKLAAGHGITHAMIPHIYLLLAYEIAQRIFPKNIGILWRSQKAAEGGYHKATKRIQTHSEAIAALDGTETEAAILSNSYKKVTGAAQDLNKASSLHDLVFKVFYTYGCRSWIQSFILYPVLKRTDAATLGGLVSDTSHSSELMIEMLVGNGNLLTLHATAQHMYPSARSLCTLFDTLDELTTQHSHAAVHSLKEAKHIEFKNVNVYTPSGNMLVRDLSFDVTEGNCLLLTGHNGAGKSSIFRCLGGLWPIREGVISKPGANTDGLCADIFYLPQKPYNVLGTLEDQLTYPASGSVKIPRSKLIDLLKQVDLLHLLDDESTNNDDTTNWEERLSLGEQQRLAMARLFYHNPKYAILDECTSAVSQDVEKMLYEECFKRGITYITICHRPALKAYHSTNLHLKGEGSNGGWEVKKLPTPDLTGKSHEIALSTSLEKAGGKKRNPLPKRSFVSKLVQLLRIVLPGSTTKTVMLVASILCRTWMHEVSTVVTGKLLKAAVDRNKDAFVKYAALNAVQDIATAFLEVSVSYMQSSISIQWQDALAKHVQKLFMSNNAYYRIKNIDGRVADPEQRMTQEVQDLSNHLSAVLSKSIQPLANVLWISYRMRQIMSTEQLAPMYMYMMGVSAIVKYFMPDHDTLVRLEQKLEGQFAFVHNRLRNHSESIAFFGGGAREAEIADGYLERLVGQQKVARRKEGFFKALSLCFMKDVEDPSQMVSSSSIFTMFLQLQVALATGASPEVLNFIKHGTTQSIDSFGKLASLYEPLTKFGGASTRVCEMLDAFAQLTPVNEGAKDDRKITFSDVDIVTPTQRTIVSGINCEVNPGKSLLVTGPNGVGKTSFFRVLAGLWEAKGVTKPIGGVSLVPQKLYMVTGTLAAQVMYPKKDVKRTKAMEDAMTKCLDMVGIKRLVSRERKQVLELSKDVLQKLKPLKGDLEQGCRVQVQIDGTGVVLRGGNSACEAAVKLITEQGGEPVKVVENEAAGLDKVEQWEHVLSLGEQQRLGIARILYHSPAFAVLDECTDAVSVDVEKDLYTQINKNGTTCITISKRLALPEFHSQQLQLGTTVSPHWTLTDIDNSVDSDN